ncbi:MAG TPA: VTT domain-containing protein [Candidatus Portnoybacteria bacterium]|jgi:membrane-associated protein|nr:VTT domain-containing protein [Candidatus Portnoybacteria bacterium]MDD5752430.1 VTT domain-containing protein [Candidatus Portnoybacteria bacterium]HNU96989.1 VTT domain-containing protein [Candidatus Portnoybacteria bacterium]HOZ16327.1 VTT domain-containing protein [Candidatus Portnoybacteria bacterium]HPH52399.1 VTT domain-containing protein [Candidatus Portnoybacteria bacterium]
MFGFDLIELIKTAGYIGLFGIIFAESGLLIGFFLPGDSLLFTAGFLASQGFLNIWILMGLTFIGAVLGDSVGYWFGKKTGNKIFIKEDSFLFKKDNINKAEEFFKKHGAKAIVLARFVPIVRTFTPILAGVGTMHYKTFLSFNVIGGALWTIGVSLLGYFLGNIIPNIDKYLLPIVLLIIIVSLLPNIVHILKSRKNKKSSAPLPKD